MTSLKKYIKFGIITLLVVCSLESFSQPLWKVSGAPLGDTSSYSYPVGGWGASDRLLLVSPVGNDSLRIFSVIGAPDGMHIYGVQRIPNAICGSAGIGGNDRYFGVFVVNGTSPSFSASYYFSGNPYYTTAIEPFLDLATRPTNADTICTTWANAGAILNTIADSLTILTQTGRKEYILTTTTTSALPISLEEFEATLRLHTVDLDWVTFSEMNNDYFVVQRSSEGVYWEDIDKINGYGTTVSKKYYSGVDFAPLNGLSYYRLKQVGFNGNYSYSKIKTVFRELNISINVFPNPTTNNCNLTIATRERQEIFITIMNTLGEIVYTSQFNSEKNQKTTVPLDVSSYQKGLYFIQVQSSSGIDSVMKLIINHR